MKIKSQSALKYGSPLMAVYRVFGFFALIAILAPAQAIYRLFSPVDPFRISLLFYRTLLKLMGFRLRVQGELSASVPTLFISNHSSYLDIPILGSLLPAAFVAKAEVRDWPLIGFLSEQQRTVFIERKSSRIGEQRNYLRECLAARKSLVLFPEGTSSDGSLVLPFKSSLFSSVEHMEGGVEVAVQPVSVICTQIGGLPMIRSWRPFYSWYGDMTLVSHLWNVFKLGNFTIDVIFHPAVKAGDFPDRKALSAYCQQQVAHGIEQRLTGRERPAKDMLKLPAPAQGVLVKA